jgi:hypothetical protein
MQTWDDNTVFTVMDSLPGTLCFPTLVDSMSASGYTPYDACPEYEEPAQHKVEDYCGRQGGQEEAHKDKRHKEQQKRMDGTKEILRSRGKKQSTTSATALQTLTTTPPSSTGSNNRRADMESASARLLALLIQLAFCAWRTHE